MCATDGSWEHGGAMKRFAAGVADPGHVAWTGAPVMFVTSHRIDCVP